MTPDHLPVKGLTVKNLFVTTGWGTWGFEAIPSAGKTMAELVALRIPPMIAPFALGRFERDRCL